jgi:hypothetical protein
VLPRPIFYSTTWLLKKLTGQGVEKNNDDVKQIIFQKSNKWDAAKDILFFQEETVGSLKT